MTALDVLAGKKGQTAALGVTEIVSGGDMGMMQIGEGVELPFQLLLAFRVQPLRPDDLERHLPAGQLIVSQINGAHATGTQLALEAIPRRNHQAERRGARSGNHDNQYKPTGHYIPAYFVRSSPLTAVTDLS